MRCQKFAARLLTAALFSSAAFPAIAQQGAQATRLSLDQAISLALTRDANLDRSNRSAEIAGLGVDNARAGYYPNASVTISANQSAAGGAYQTQDVTLRRGIAGSFAGSVRADVSMPIDISGTIGRQVDAAELRRAIAELSQDKARRNALIDGQIAYLAALQAQQMVTIDQAIVGSIESLKNVSAKKLPAVLPFFDVELANAREQLRNSRAAADQAEDGLKLALRLPFELDIQLTSALPDYSNLPSIGAKGLNLDDSLDVQTSKRSLEAAELGVEQAKDFRRPSLRIGAYAAQTFSGRFIDEAGQTRNRDYGLNVSLSLPLLNYDAGRSDNSVRTSKLMAEQARVDLETTRLNVTLSIRQARQALQRAEKRLTQLPDPKAASQALTAATRALLQAPAATAPALLAQVSNARNSWRFAQSSVMDAKVGAVIAALRLSKALDQPLIL
jgi:adhesin transport system outer membrane protein